MKLARHYINQETLFFLAEDFGEADRLLRKVEEYAKQRGLSVVEGYAALVSYALSRLETLKRDKERQEKQRAEQEADCTHCEQAFYRKNLTRAFQGLLCEECLTQFARSRLEQEREERAKREEARAAKKAIPAPKHKKKKVA